MLVVVWYWLDKTLTFGAGALEQNYTPTFRTSLCDWLEYTYKAEFCLSGNQVIVSKLGYVDLIVSEHQAWE